MPQPCTAGSPETLLVPTSRALVLHRCCPTQRRCSVVAYSVPFLALLNASAMASDGSAVARGAPAFYPQSLQDYPQALQVDSQSAQDNHQTSEPTYKFSAKFNAGDAAQESSGALQGFFAPRKNWEQNQISDLKLNFSTIGDWV